MDALQPGLLPNRSESGGGGITAGRDPHPSPTPSRGQPPRQPRRRRSRSAPAPIGERAERIEGRFRRITVHQITLAWWLYAAGHITRRQLRVYFAAHELAERRRYTSEEHRGSKPLYTIEELSLIHISEPTRPY